MKVYTGKKYVKYTVKTNSSAIAKIKTNKLAIGTHKVTINSGNKSYNLSKSSKIIVKKSLDTTKTSLAPTLVSTQFYPKNEDYYAVVRWNAKNNSDYQILRKLNETDYGVLANVKANSGFMSFYDKIDSDKFYTYTVREILKNGSGKILGAYDIEGLKIMDRPNVTVDFQNLKAVIKWDKIPNATKYRIFRKMGRDGNYELIDVVDAKNLNYTDFYYNSVKELKSIISGDTFIDPSYNNLFYTVRASNIKKVNGVTKTSYGLYYKDGDFHLEAPSIVSLKSTIIKWGKVPNADGYIVLKRNTVDDEWEEIGSAVQKTSTCISLTLNGIDKDAYYTVKAFASKNGEIVYSKFDEGFSLRNFNEDYSDYSILYFGDSITYGSPYKAESTRHIFSIPNRVAELLGCNFYNPSIPGSTYHDLGYYEENGTIINIENTNYYRYRICREVVDQIAIGELPGNWEELDTAQNSKGETNTTISDYNIVVLAAGTNDYLDNSILGSLDSNDTTTFNGALNHIMEQIVNASLKRIEEGKDAIKVVFVDLYYSDRTNNYKIRQNRDITPNKIGLTLTDYQNALLTQYDKWQNLTEDVLTFYNFKTRDYEIVNEENCPYTASDNLHFTKFVYGQYGNAFAQFLVDNVFE